MSKKPKISRDFGIIKHDNSNAILAKKFSSSQLKIILSVIRLSLHCQKFYAHIPTNRDWEQYGVSEKTVINDLTILSNANIILPVDSGDIKKATRFAFNYNVKSWDISYVNRYDLQKTNNIICINLPQNIGSIELDMYNNSARSKIDDFAEIQSSDESENTPISPDLETPVNIQDDVQTDIEGSINNATNCDNLLQTVLETGKSSEEVISELSKQESGKTDKPKKKKSSDNQEPKIKYAEYVSMEERFYNELPAKLYNKALDRTGLKELPFSGEEIRDKAIEIINNWLAQPTTQAKAHKYNYNLVAQGWAGEKAIDKLIDRENTRAKAKKLSDNHQYQTPQQTKTVKTINIQDKSWLEEDEGKCPIINPDLLEE